MPLRLRSLDQMDATRKELGEAALDRKRVGVRFLRNDAECLVTGVVVRVFEEHCHVVETVGDERFTTVEIYEVIEIVDLNERRRLQQKREAMAEAQESASSGIRMKAEG